MAYRYKGVCGHNVPSTLEDYRAMKLQLLDDFCITLNVAQMRHFNSLKDTDALDRYVHDVIRDSKDD